MSNNGVRGVVIGFLPSFREVELRINGDVHHLKFGELVEKEVLSYSLKEKADIYLCITNGALTYAQIEEEDVGC
jgi:hypothetical protein